MTEEPLRARKSFRRVFIDDPSQLTEVLGQLQQCDRLGVDLEMGQKLDRKPGGYQEWIHVLSLVQIAGGDLSVVIDALRCPVEPLKPLMSGRMLKVFLGGGQDAALLEREDIPARNVVDVGEIALALFGRRQDGMAALADRIFGISLDKTVRRADWLARPVNPTLLAYAHQDAELTLQIYEWFSEHYSESVSDHTRAMIEAELPPSTPEWLRIATLRSSSDPLAVVMESGLDVQRDADRMSADVRAAIVGTSAPRLLNRLLRLAGDLQLVGLLPEALEFARSRSSLIRASSARALGLLASPEVGRPLLEELKADPIEDVRKAAEAALRDLLRPVAAASAAEDEPPAPALNDNAMSALAQLKAQLEDTPP